MLRKREVVVSLSMNFLSWMKLLWKNTGLPR
jgi:hypothetical protein